MLTLIRTDESAVAEPQQLRCAGRIGICQEGRAGVGVISVKSWDRRGAERVQLAGTKARLTIARDAEASAQVVVFVTIHLRPRDRTLATLGPTATAALRGTDYWLQRETENERD